MQRMCNRVFGRFKVKIQASHSCHFLCLRASNQITDGQTDRLTRKQTATQEGRQTERQAGAYFGRQTQRPWSTDRQADRVAEQATNRLTDDRKTEGHICRPRRADTQKNRDHQTDRQTDPQTDSYADRQKYKPKSRCRSTDSQKHRQANRQTKEQTHRPTGWQNNRLTDTATYFCPLFFVKSLCRGGTVLRGSSVGSGRGPIWLDDLYCIGNETNIADCRRKQEWGETDVSRGHAEDVGVECHQGQRCIHVCVPRDGYKKVNYLYIHR